METNFCKIHKESVLYCEQNIKTQFCRLCIQNELSNQNIYETNRDYFDDKKQLATQELNSVYDSKIKELEDFAEKLRYYILQIQQVFNQLQLLVNKNLSNLIEKKNQINDFTSLEFTHNNEKECFINNLLIQINGELTIQLKNLENNIKLDQLYQSLNKFSIVVKKEMKEQSNVTLPPGLKKTFNYRLMQQSSYKQNEQCCAFAFNKNASIMIATCNSLIKVFEFQNYKPKEIQQLNKHTSFVYCLEFMNKSNQFISASYDQTIIIWEQDSNFQWQYNQVLKGHQSYIYCITINQNEDQIISGSGDQTINFWKKQKKTWSSIQQIDCKSQVFSISLSNSDDKLIASVTDNVILVIQLKIKWMIVQKISVEQFGYRLCFINSDQFVFQPSDRLYLLVFNYDTKSKSYKKGQEIQYVNKGFDDCRFFPIRYIQQIGLIIVKNDYHIHLIKRFQNGEFTVAQSINFGTNQLIGGITDDGMHIATWDCHFREIQIRELEF